MKRFNLRGKIPRNSSPGTIATTARSFLSLALQLSLISGLECFKPKVYDGRDGNIESYQMYNSYKPSLIYAYNCIRAVSSWDL